MKNDIKILDDFLTKYDFENIKNKLTSNSFPWYYNDHVTDVKETNSSNFQFCHMFYERHVPNSDFMHLVSPVMEKLKMTATARIKANLLLKTKEIKIFDYHKDFLWNHKWWSAIYYINTNNGKTLFKNIDKEIESKENRLIMFDGRLKHTGTTCTDKKNRIVINFNFYNKELDEL